MRDLAWRSVIQPTIMPKPDLVPLTGGYRRAPVMQIGADVYCDTQVILAEIERRCGVTTDGKGWMINFWADRAFFQSSVAVIFGEMGAMVPQAFIDDREKLMGRAFDVAAMRAAGVPMQAQWRAQAGWIESALASGAPFLAGAAPGLADVAAYMNIWFAGAFTPDVAARLLAGMDRLQAWRERLKAVGHGRRSEMTTAEALDAARAAEPDETGLVHDPAERLAPGAAVTVSADDYGRDPIAGRLAAANLERTVIAREDDRLGCLHIHFPRAGYLLAAAG
jgi:glutathione S-transferase